MPAELITRFKSITPDGGVIEWVVWRVPTPVPPTEHGFKYRAVYAKDGARTVGFDNERGKGELSVRELARRVDRDVKRVHEDVVVLADLGLLERTESGGVVCPFSSMHIDMVLKAA
jgi:hypothetical protein